MARSSSGLGHRPLKAEIRGSNPLRATKRAKTPVFTGVFATRSRSCTDRCDAESFVAAEGYELVSLRPTMPPTSIARKSIRGNVAGSP